MKHEGDGDTKCRWCSWNGSQRPGKETGGTEDEKNRDHHDHVTAQLEYLQES